MRLRYFSISCRFLLLSMSFAVPALMSPVAVHAQRTYKDADPQSTYNKGVELFESMYYASAQKVFRDYLNMGDNSQLQRGNANYYIAVSAMELFQDDAENLLLNFKDNYPEHPKAVFVNYYLGKFYFRNNDYERASQAFAKVDGSTLGGAAESEFYLMNGYVNFKANNLPEAKRAFSKVKEVPGNLQPFATYYYGYIAYLDGKYNEALQEFEKLKDNKKFKAQIPVYITQIYLLQGKYDEAIRYGKQALEDKETEKTEDVKLYMGEAYFRKGDYANALATFTTYPGQLTEHHMYQLGVSQYNLEQYSDAIASLSNITIKEDSLGQNITFHLANSYLKTGDKFKAKNAYDFSGKLKFFPAIKELSEYNATKLNYELGFQKEAIDGLRAFIGKYPKSAYLNEAQELLSQLLVSADNPQEALDILKAMPNRNARLNEAYQKINYALGIQYVQGNQHDEARKYFEESLRYPSDRKVKASCNFWIGEIDYRAGRTKNALENYKAFLASGESQGSPYYNVANYNLGYCYFKQESWAIASDYFKRYLNAEQNKKSKRAVDATLRVADCHFMQRNFPAALQAYDELVNVKPPVGDYALYHKGIIFEQQDKPEQEISALRTLIKSYSESNLLDDAQFSVAEAYNNMQNYAQAIKEYEYLNKNWPRNPYYLLALLQIGQAQDNMGNVNAAKGTFSTIINKYPYSDEAKQAYRFLERIVMESGQTEVLDSLRSAIPENRFQLQSPDSVYYNTAYTNYLNGNCDAAIKAFKNYLTKFKDPFFLADAYYYMGICEQKKGLKKDALEHLNVVVARTPNNFVESALLLTAELYYEDKNYDMALKRYEQLELSAGQRENVQAGIVGSMMSAYFLKSYDKCIEASNKLLNISALDERTKTLAKYFQAKSQLELNQLDQAEAVFNQLYQNDKTEIGAEALYQSAYILFLKEKYKESENLILSKKEQFSIYDYWKAKAYILISDIYAYKYANGYVQAKGILETLQKNYKGKDEIPQTVKEKLAELENRKKAGN